MDSEVSQVHTLVCPILSCVVMGKLFNFPAPQFLYLLNGDNNTT